MAIHYSKDHVEIFPGMPSTDRAVALLVLRRALMKLPESVRSYSVLSVLVHRDRVSVVLLYRTNEAYAPNKSLAFTLAKTGEAAEESTKFFKDQSCDEVYVERVTAF